MRVIGLTGGIASGKSTISEALHEHGAVIIDADKVGHEAYLPGTETWQALVDHFSRDILTESGEIDRRKLGGIVFSDPSQREALQNIVWPRMKEMMRRRLDDLRKSGVTVAVIEAAVLLEAGWTDLVDEIWVAEVSEPVAIARLMARNNLTEADALARIRSQLSNEQRAARANVVINNDGTVAQARERLAEAWMSLYERVNAAT
jgi:dephospho-CoA kinase